MGTNYYAKIIPSIEDKEELKRAIDVNDIPKIEKLTDKMYGRIQYDASSERIVGGEVHLGKRSAGWKFLWNPNMFIKPIGHLEEIEVEPGYKHSIWIKDSEECVKLYELTKESIKEFIDREDVDIYDEYHEKQDKAEFFNMALHWGYGKDDEGWDGGTYADSPINDNLNLRSGSYYKTRYAEFIEKCGYELNKCNTDFYSDGMRFSTSREFS